jgi:hypothetical protein
MVGVVGLNQGASALLAPACTPDDLRQQLEHALAGAEVGQVQPRVRADNTYQRHAREVQPARRHLRANQHL